MMRTMKSERRRVSASGIATLLLTASLAIAKTYDIACDTISLGAVAVEQVLPEFPQDESLRKGQEGWVQVNFVISPDGRTVDPVVVDSAGGEAFEQAAINAVSQWRFEATGSEIPSNAVAIRFEESKDSDRASRNFMRWYRLVLTDLADDKVDKARENLDRARAFGGWNLYEATILEVLEGRVADVEGDRQARLDALRRAKRMGDETALNPRMRRELLSSLIRLETELHHYASARDNLASLRELEGSAPLLRELEAEIARLDSELGESITVAASLAPPCNCEAGSPVWVHKPSGRSFVFRDIDGNVERFEARCDKERLSARIASQEAWSMPEEWGDCEVLVFGDDGASFSFVELPADAEDSTPGSAALAMSEDLN